MARHWLRINHAGDSIQLSWQRGQSSPRSALPVRFEHPFNDQVLADLRWYLEDYLRFPYERKPENAKQIEQKFQQWGQQLFELVFPRTSKAWDFFQEATREGLDQCELNISSDDPAVLNLPWELLYSPDHQFLAPSLAGTYRSLSDYAVRAEMGQLPQDKLNILLVIARPYGERDVALRTIARPMLEALKPIRQRVNFKVLRPPSFEQFEQELNTHKGFYHIVHFDGHGDFDPNSVGFRYSFGSAGQGVLVFENADGSPQIITAAQIAQSLTDCRVPIFVLNACKSAQEGSGSFSSVATRLVSLGAKGVVAMAYSVYAEAAKHFIGRLYEQLVKGADLSSAVASGRRKILSQCLRPSPRGNLPLQDWLVPVLYQQETYTPFTPLPTDTDGFNIDELLKPTVTNLVEEFPEEGPYGFIGRDYDISRLERGFRQNNIVLLQGMGGVGKTELACGFARWLEETQGRSGLIMLISFEKGMGLSYVVNQIGREAWGVNRFSQYPPEEQQKAVLNYLRTKPCLLIWDNFETVAGSLESESLLSTPEQDSLRQFLKQLRGGKSWVLITSRREEAWLNCGYRLLGLRGLLEQDVEELAAKILQTAGVDTRKLPQEYLELLKLLGGHPFSLGVVLPHLKTQSAEQLIETLQQGLDTFQGKEEEGRDKSLIVSLDYSFAKLSERARQHLPVLALFSERVDADVLHNLFSTPNNEPGKTYQAVFGENLQKLDWIRLLNEATEVGILDHRAETFYKIHPVLPWYLRRKLSEQHSAEKVSELGKKLLMSYALSADKAYQALISQAQTATGFLLIEEPNLLQNLRFALQQQNWNAAYAILPALGELYERENRKPEFKSLRQQALRQVGSSRVDARAKGQSAFRLWIYLRGEEAKEAAQYWDQAKAFEIYQELLKESRSFNEPSIDDMIAGLHQSLGIIAQRQGDYETAQKYFGEVRQFLENTQEDPYKAATFYHQLGASALQQGNIDEAIDYTQKSLIIRENHGDHYNAGNDYYQLAQCLKAQDRIEEALQNCNQALSFWKDSDRVAEAHMLLGNLLMEQGKLREATENYERAIQIYEDQETFYKAALVYHNLGMIAEERQQPEEAISYYEKALDIFIRFCDLNKVVLTYRKISSIDLDYYQIRISNDVKVLEQMSKAMGKERFWKTYQEIWVNERPNLF